MCSRTMKHYLSLGAPERESRTRILMQEVYLGGKKESRRLWGEVGRKTEKKETLIEGVS